MANSFYIYRKNLAKFCLARPLHIPPTKSKYFCRVCMIQQWQVFQTDGQFVVMRLCKLQMVQCAVCTYGAHCRVCKLQLVCNVQIVQCVDAHCRVCKLQIVCKVQMVHAYPHCERASWCNSCPPSLSRVLSPFLGLPLSPSLPLFPLNPSCLYCCCRWTKGR